MKEAHQRLFKAHMREPSSIIRYEEFIVVKITPCGQWLVRATSYRGHKDKQPARPYNKCLDGLVWLPFDSRKMSPSKEGALEQLEYRARAHVRHCRRRLKKAELRADLLGVGVLDTSLDLHWSTWGPYDG